ncbi:MAG: transglutaminaseTgpA domain-containing protein [Pseudomonadota bacterium]
MSSTFFALSRLPREARDTLFLLGVVGWIIVPLIPHVPPWASAFAAALLLARAVLAWQGRPLPGRWVLGGLLALAVAGTALTFKTLAGRDAGVTLIVLLLALKTLELRARRDAMVVFFLGFFTLLSNFLFSQSLATAAAMLLALLGLLTALVQAHMPVGRPPLMLAMRTALRLMLLGAPVMAALFLLFPRIAPLWGLPKDTLARSGLAGDMQVGRMAALALDDGIALRVRFDLPGGRTPPQSALYFRGPVLASFDGRTWSALDDMAQGGPWRRVSSPAALQVSGAPLRYEVTLEPHQQNWLLLIDAAPAPPGLPEGFQAAMSPELLWRTNRPVMSVLRYRAESYPQFRHGPLQRNATLNAYTELPAGFNPRTLALAAQLRAQTPVAPGADPAPALVQAALARLRTGGYRYTLEPGVFGTHSADEFWFDRKQGFCEHIASAFVVLLRAMGLPARIVTGYQGGEVNPVDGYWTVRHSDAHAWTEVWLAGQGWVRVDPTAAVAPGRVGSFARLQAPAGAFATAMNTVISPGMVQQLRAIWEAMNNGWNQWVLNYTQGRQLDLLRALGFDAPAWPDLIRLLGALLAAAALGGAAWTLWERRQHDPWLRLLARTRRRLARAGLPLPAHLPPRAMARAVQAHFGPAAQPLAQWLQQLEQLRYAAPAPGAAQQPTQTLRTLARTWRRLPWPRPQPRHERRQRRQRRQRHERRDNGG